MLPYGAGMAPPDWKQYSPDETPDDETSATSAVPKPVRSLDERTVRRTGGFPVGIVVGAVAAVGAVAGVILLLGAGGEPGDDEPQSANGFDALVADLDEETGSTTIRRAVIYPDYAVLTVPYDVDDPADERELSYYWDGSFGDPTKGTGDALPFDLATVDGTVLDGLCPQVEELVEDPETCYLVIDKPADDDGTPEWITASTSNEFGQSAQIEFELDGTVVEVRPPS